MSRDRSDDQILAERDVFERRIVTQRAILVDLMDQQRALGCTTRELDHYNGLCGVKKDKVREERDTMDRVDPTMWKIFSQGYAVKPIDRFEVSYFLRQFRKRRDINWKTLVPLSDLAVLERYAFDDTGLRQYRKRLMRTIADDLRREHYGDPYLPLDVIEAAIRVHAPTLQFDLTELRETFGQRWANRMAIAKTEPAYQEEGSITKRKLDALEADLVERASKKQRVSNA